MDVRSKTGDFRFWGFSSCKHLVGWGEPQQQPRPPPFFPCILQTQFKSAATKSCCFLNAEEADMEREVIDHDKHILAFPFRLVLFFGFGGILGWAFGSNFPSPWATMLALRLDCSSATHTNPKKFHPSENWSISRCFGDRTRTGIPILTSAADYYPGMCWTSLDQLKGSKVTRHAPNMIMHPLWLISAAWRVRLCVRERWMSKLW